MERMFRTFIKADHKFGKNDYVRGRIHGIQEIICDGERNGIDKPAAGPTWYIPDVGHQILTKCEPEQYERFRELVEKHYPGLCIFDVGAETKTEEEP